MTLHYTHIYMYTYFSNFTEIDYITRRIINITTNTYSNVLLGSTMFNRTYG